MAIESILNYAQRVRELRRAGPTNLEQALAPEFKTLLENLLPQISTNQLVVVPEYASPGIGRPDIALTRQGQLPRAFVELKAPTKPGDPSRYRDQHDKAQFERLHGSLEMVLFPMNGEEIIFISFVKMTNHFYANF